jgi:hypothetical protein
MPKNDNPNDKKDRQAALKKLLKLISTGKGKGKGKVELPRLLVCIGFDREGSFNWFLADCLLYRAKQCYFIENSCIIPEVSVYVVSSIHVALLNSCSKARPPFHSTNARGTSADN